MVEIADIAKDHRRGIDHIGVSVSFIIHDGNGNIMLHKRGQQARDEQGRWDVGGGALEFGESIDEAIRRELKEEFCVDAIEIDFLTAFDAHRKHNGVPTHWIALLHAVKVDPSQVQNGEPHKIDEIGWFTSENLPSPLHSQFEKAFAAATKAGVVR